MWFYGCKKHYSHMQICLKNEQIKTFKFNLKILKMFTINFGFFPPLSLDTPYWILNASNYNTHSQ